MSAACPGLLRRDAPWRFTVPLASGHCLRVDFVLTRPNGTRVFVEGRLAAAGLVLGRGLLPPSLVLRVWPCISVPVSRPALHAQSPPLCPPCSEKRNPRGAVPSCSQRSDCGASCRRGARHPCAYVCGRAGPPATPATGGATAQARGKGGQIGGEQMLCSQAGSPGGWGWGTTRQQRRWGRRPAGAGARGSASPDRPVP